jgi:hypothetical protein
MRRPTTKLAGVAGRDSNGGAHTHGCREQGDSCRRPAASAVKLQLACQLRGGSPGVLTGWHAVALAHVSALQSRARRRLRVAMEGLGPELKR